MHIRKLGCSLETLHQTCDFLGFLGGGGFVFVCLFVVVFFFALKTQRKQVNAMTHIQFAVLFSLYFQVRSNSYFPFFL